MNEDLLFLGLITLVVFTAALILYVYIPLKVWWTYSQQADPEVIPFDPASTEMPPDVRANFAEHHQRLLNIGFQYLQTLSLPRFQTNVHQVLACYAREADLCSVQIVALHLVRNGRLQPAKCFLMISTRLSADTWLSTSNLTYSLLRSSAYESQYFPEVLGVERLLEIHAATLAERQLVPNQRGEFFRYRENPAKTVQETTQLLQSQMAQEGIYVRAADGKQLHLTLIYAYIITWKFLFPLNFIENYLVKLRARKRIAALESGGWLAKQPWQSL